MAIRDLITDSIIIMLIVEMISGSGYGLHDAEIILLEKLPLEQRVQLESKILNFLGLTSPPQPDLDTLRKSRPAYKYMLALYQSFLDQKVLNISDDVFKRRLALADTVMSFVDHAPPIHFLPQWNSTVRIHFDLNGLQSTDLLLGANLRLFINAKYYSSRTAFFDIHVFQDSNLSAQIFSEATVMRVSKNFVGWLDVDVTKEVEYWRNTFPVNSGFLLKVTDSTGILVQPFCIHLAGQTEKSKKKKAFLVVITKSLRQKDNIAAGRNKRSNGYISQKQSRIEETLAYSTHQSYGSRKLSRCQRRTLYISFRDFGWQKWLIAPEGYYAHFCGGDCSFPLHTHMNATNHAIIQSLIHLMKPSNVPKPCCAPTKLNSLPVLYHYKSPNVILKRYRNMIVKACGCH